MQITYPKSFLKLLLIGFALAMLPLLVVFVNANIYFGKLTKQSLFNMSQAVETTRSSRILLEELAVMERSARQYFVLHDKLLFENYVNAHDRFSNAINILLSLPISKSQQPQLLALAKQENNLFNSISDDENSSFDQSMMDAFTHLTNQGYKITEQSNRLIDQEAALFKTKVVHTQQLLFWQTFTLIPLAVLIVGLITWMIARPIRRMDAAIHKLGRGDYEHEIEINGPGDLRQLGARLNWLRLALKDLHQQKQRFLQQASHELKTPLTAIREASELLNDGIAGKLNQTQSEVVHILRENSLRLQKMIENLLNYTEIQFNSTEHQFGLSEPKLMQQSLSALVNEILHAYELSISQKKITVISSTDDIIMHVDIEKLRTILDNLISNAVKFTPNNGEITINASQSKSMLTIEVKDTGQGISQANLIGIFEPFYRGEQPNGSLVAGSGLGLFIAKEAVNALKGEIKLVPSQIGAHFILNLPLPPAV
ncbi:MAG: HAMP domain-containing sensor histidine kinase [Methylotenera sp.]|nr:HAMP domain-containing sensor histidine kinase [Methylotenera sp.]